VSAGLKYTMDNMNISVGYSYVMPGDVTITHDVAAAGATPATTLKTVYENSTVQAIGVRIGVNF
jgi:long-subunit fatty acid transport protein